MSQEEFDPDIDWTRCGRGHTMVPMDQDEADLVARKGCTPPRPIGVGAYFCPTSSSIYFEDEVLFGEFS